MASENRPKRNLRWWICAFGVALIVLALVALILILPPGENFLVNGVPVREWIAHNPDVDIENPLASVGTNALPSFIRILRERDESVKFYQMKLAAWQHLPIFAQKRLERWYPVPQWELKWTALTALRALGLEAKTALPDVLRVGRQRNRTQTPRRCPPRRSAHSA
jgi:hypothetical protein